MIRLFTGPKVEYSNCSIVNRFEEQVNNHPDKIAILTEGESFTYKDIQTRVNRLSHYLKNGLKIEYGDIVGILSNRRPEFIIGVLAILKIGAAYMPIDRNYPQTRIKYMIENSGSKILLLPVREAEMCENIGVNNVYIDEIINQTYFDIVDKESTIEPYENNLMYVIYTSGSTGNPKGAKVKCHSFLNLLNWYIDELKLKEDDRVLFFTSISFDLAQKNIFAPLITGASICLFSKDQFNVRAISDLIENQNITLINTTPSAFLPIIEYNQKDQFKKLTSLRNVVLGGEALNIYQYLPWLNSEECESNLYNTYGPTECTDIAAFYKVDRRKKDTLSKVPIGIPINNVEIYCIKEEEVDGPWEVYIGGEGVGAGYLNLPEDTAMRFIYLSDNPNKLLYRTGDLVTITLDGNLEFVGRVDNQYKIRGHRIEVEEIESFLARHDHINNSAVLVKERNESKFLCLYYESNNHLTELEVKQYMQAHLPEYMVPDFIVQLDELPLNHHGKVDKQSLPDLRAAPEPSLSSQEHIEENVRLILKKYTKFPEQIDYLDSEENLEHLGIDSIVYISVLVAIETEYNLQFEDEMLEPRSLPNLRSIVNHIQGAMK